MSWSKKKFDKKIESGALRVKEDSLKAFDDQLVVAEKAKAYVYNIQDEVVMAKKFANRAQVKAEAKRKKSRMLSLPCAWGIRTRRLR